MSLIWKPREDAIIIQYYPEGGSKAVNERLSSNRQRKATSINYRAAHLGIKTSFRDHSKFQAAQDCSVRKVGNKGDKNWNLNG